MRNFVYDNDTQHEKKIMKYLIHDRGPQFTDHFDLVFTSENTDENKIIVSKYAQMNSFCERVIQ